MKDIREGRAGGQDHSEFLLISVSEPKARRKVGPTNMRLMMTLPNVADFWQERVLRGAIRNESEGRDIRKNVYEIGPRS